MAAKIPKTINAIAARESRVDIDIVMDTPKRDSQIFRRKKIATTH
jgi:hypothetical protein